jgi:hypothetical protein
MLLNVTGPHLKKSLSNSRGVPTILEMFLRIDILFMLLQNIEKE